MEQPFEFPLHIFQTLRSREILSILICPVSLICGPLSGIDVVVVQLRQRIAMTFLHTRCVSFPHSR